MTVVDVSEDARIVDWRGDWRFRVITPLSLVAQRDTRLAARMLERGLRGVSLRRRYPGVTLGD